jgi:uncharacterized membrane protein
MLSEFINQTAINLVLAVIPPVLAYRLGRARERIGPGTVVLGLVWLAFLPNTTYLLTEWRHFLFDEPFTTWREGGQRDRAGMFMTAVAGFLYMGYACFGMLAFALSLRPVERLFRRRGWRLFPWAPILFFDVSVGVYIGLIDRLNSWDLLDPVRVLSAGVSALTRPRSVLGITGFAVFLWAAYEAVDLWLDGVADRWARFRENRRLASLRSTSTTSAAPASEGRDQPATRE